MTENINRILAEWAGFRNIAGVFWGAPETASDSITSLPNFTSSLDDCYKFLVPRLIQTYSGFTDIQFSYFGNGRWACFLWLSGVISIPEIKSPIMANSMALALCLAIEYLICEESSEH